MGFTIQEQVALQTFKYLSLGSLHDISELQWFGCYYIYIIEPQHNKTTRHIIQLNIEKGIL